MITFLVIMFLSLPLFVIVIFALIITLLCLMQMHFLRVDARQTLLFDGESWFITQGLHDKQPLSMAPQLVFKSDSLLLIRFKMKNAKRNSTIYLTRHNCAEAQYRAVCRIL